LSDCEELVYNNTNQFVLQEREDLGLN